MLKLPLKTPKGLFQLCQMMCFLFCGKLFSDVRSRSTKRKICQTILVAAALASRDNFVVCAVVNLLSGLLSSLVRPYLDQALQSSARFYSEWAASRFRPVPSVAEDYKTALQSFALSPKSGDVASDRNVTKWGTTHPPTPCCSARLSWPHLFNDLATCIEYINSLVTASEAEFLKHQNAETEAEQGKRERD